MTCQRQGCLNPVKGPRARFCSGACKQLDYRNRRNTATVTPGMRPHQIVTLGKDGFVKPLEAGDIPLGKVCEVEVNAKPLPPFVYKQGVPIKRKTTEDFSLTRKNSARNHSPGCPCWTCKGVPSKQTKKV